MVMNYRFYISCAVIMVLLVETLFLGNSFSLQWHSPKFMYQLSAWLVPVKFLLTCLALGWLSRLVLSGWQRYSRYVTSTLAILHLLLLSLVGVGYAFAGFAPLSKQFRLEVISRSTPRIPVQWVRPITTLAISVVTNMAFTI